MPLYQYECESCGPFQTWTGMSESQKSVECPACTKPSARTVAAPFIARMDAARRQAHARNEKSAHEPMVMSRQQLEKLGRPRHGHSHANHACSHVHHPGAERLETIAGSNTAPDRPWLIGH